MSFQELLLKITLKGNKNFVLAKVFQKPPKIDLIFQIIC